MYTRIFIPFDCPNPVAFPPYIYISISRAVISSFPLSSPNISPRPPPLEAPPKAPAAIPNTSAVDCGGPGF